MPLPKEQTYTIDDIYALPEGVRAELIDGQIYYMSPPNRRHQEISGELSRLIGNYIKSKNGLCKVYAAPFAVFLNADDKTYVEPDISVICDKSKLTDRGCVGSPDWIIEIVSPSSVKHDYTIKAGLYNRAGVREYWIVDARKNYVIVHNFETEDVTIYTFNDTVKVGIYEDLYINFKEIVELL